jgi:hypothetical protein
VVAFIAGIVYIW